MISSEPQNILLPNVVCLCSIINQSVMQKNWFIVFNVKVTARAYIIKIWLSVVPSKLLVRMQPNMVWYYSIISQSALWKSGITAFRSRSQGRFKMSVNVCQDDISWVTELFSYQIWYGDAASWVRVSCRKCSSLLLLLLLTSRSRSQWGLILSKYASFYCIFWSVDSLAAKLGLMIHHHKPECPVKKIGLLHSGARSQQRVKMIVQMISSKPPNILFPNLVLWCIIMSWSVMQNDVFAIFIVKVTARAHMIIIW